MLNTIWQSSIFANSYLVVVNLRDRSPESNYSLIFYPLAPSAYSVDNP
ncbi:hypothetical protein H6G74_25755 [Nostoc spongiaeforme FACHB-130]|uniref:Uncharacterized protein n=1 Tax=Nostoc spongiaeforme FACHB-130 TaxID=1357510 RepID=A0ABR8G399_9NOSO|nr:hypothetical protein [Nostoc spongiaeforme]MBD2597703.1 hypothetical protein [Nostoc spongiaeforme FACHB-130]